MVWTTLATPSAASRSKGRRRTMRASGKLINRPSASAVRLTRT